MLEFARKEEAASKDFIMKPPEIIFSTNPAVLVSIDGEPKLQPVEGKKLMRVINAPYTILLDTQTKKYYLGSGENWVSASDILGDLSDVLDSIRFPLAVRSSSLLEDAMYQPFAGIYATVMVPNSSVQKEVRFF